MNKQKLVVVLLVVAIILSALNLIVGLGVNADDFTSVSNQQGQTATQGGQVSFEVLDNGVNQNG